MFTRIGFDLDNQSVFSFCLGERKSAVKVDDEICTAVASTSRYCCRSDSRYSFEDRLEHVLEILLRMRMSKLIGYFSWFLAVSCG